MTNLKTPTKVETVSGVKEVACGVAHTLALSTDGLTVWSFGSGDSGKLGHGDTVKQTTPKVLWTLICFGMYVLTFVLYLLYLGAHTQARYTAVCWFLSVCV